MADPDTDHAAKAAKQAGQAWHYAQNALREGDLDLAERWLDRARRLAPADDAVALSYGVLQLQRGRPAAAAALLETLLERTDIREGWLALAAARAEIGDLPGAAQALGTMLSRHALPFAPELAQLADRVAQATGAAGWCGVEPGGALRIAAGGARTRRSPRADGTLHVSVEGRALLGSPIDMRHMRRVEGVATPRDGGIEGWAWCPANPDIAPVLTVAGARGKGSFTIVADDAGMDAPKSLSRPRRYRIEPARLVHLHAPVSVRDATGAHLPGSPLDPQGEARGAAIIARAVAKRYPAHGRAAAAPLALAAAPVGPRGIPAQAVLQPTRPVAIVVPVHRGAAVTLECLAQVRATTPGDTVLIVVDDATPEPSLAKTLDVMAHEGRIRLLRHTANRGFPASANAGLREAAALATPHDVVLLNSDTDPAPGWLDILRRAVHAAADIGTATPLSNDATILSYPHATRANPAPSAADLTRLGRDAAKAARGEVVDIPTAVGFCMYIRHECLEAVGLFRDDVFAQGYGEENDFCIRAHHLGWRHIGVPGAYVAHLSGQSFGAATGPLLTRNLEVLERLHPGYNALIAAFQARDPLHDFRRRLDTLRWRAARPRGRTGAVILVTHDQRGGVERVVRRRITEIAAEGLRPIVLRPAPPLPPAKYITPGMLAVQDGADHDDRFPNLRFMIPAELSSLAVLLRHDTPASLEVHHLLGHDHAVLQLARLLGGIDTSYFVHDYAAFCPRVSLLGPERRYCGEPSDPSVCDACVTDADAAIYDHTTTAELRARSARDLVGASRILVPSQDTATRLRRHFPTISPEVQRLQNDAALPALTPVVENGIRRVAVVGAIGTEKGFDILLACARDAAARRLKLEFVVVGHTSDDARLLATGTAFITGRYSEDEADALLRAQGAHLAFLPSIWPETWCFALGTAWQAGLAAVVFDIGAQAERVRATGRGWVLPLGLPATAINNALLSVRIAAGDV